MNKITKNIIIGAAATIMVSGSIDVIAQGDFFNGQPGPRLTQLDHYLNIDRQTGKINGTYIAKAFPSIGTNTKLLVALPMGVSKEGVDMKGINLGIMKQKMFGKELYGVAAIGAFKDKTGYLNDISSQVYATLNAGKISVDVEAMFNVNCKNKNTHTKASATIGYGNDRIRGGGSITVEQGKKPQLQAIARYDITKNHQFWLETYVSKQRAGIRLAANF